MAVQITATGASEIGPGIWSFDIPPHQIRHFGHTIHAIGTSSVLMLASCEYDAEKQQLQFAIEDATPINVGITSKVIGIAANSRAADLPGFASKKADDSVSFGPGDREFLRLAKTELSETTAKAAESLLREVRRKSSGNLKKGKTRNFSETPDNFWYVKIQPRVDDLSITVRGTVEHFKSVADMEIKDDRGNTLFKVRNENDVPAALKMIFHAHRKS